MKTRLELAVFDTERKKYFYATPLSFAFGMALNLFIITTSPFGGKKMTEWSDAFGMIRDNSGIFPVFPSVALIGLSNSVERMFSKAVYSFLYREYVFCSFY